MMKSQKQSNTLNELIIDAKSMIELLNNGVKDNLQIVDDYLIDHSFKQKLMIGFVIKDNNTNKVYTTTIHYDFAQIRNIESAMTNTKWGDLYKEFDDLYIDENGQQKVRLYIVENHYEFK